MEALLTRGAACCSSRKLLRSLISDTPLGSAVVDWLEGRNAVLVCAVHDVRIPSAITARPTVCVHRVPSHLAIISHSSAIL
jgi:hypothetical protein